MKPLLALLCCHALAAPNKPLQVYILAGQSNMQGHAMLRTFEHIGMDPATKPMHDSFRAAMAAPAKLPEFKGNVAAIWTEKYWDMELSAAKAKDNEVRQKAKKTRHRGQTQTRR